MKQNKVVRDANPMDRLTKSFDEVIRRAHILKQCEVALTIIGKFILINNPNLMKDSESKPQNGGNINEIAKKIKEIKEGIFDSKESDKTNGFDDTHPFTLLESMINYNGLLNILCEFFINQYDSEMDFENSENTKNTGDYEYIFNEIKKRLVINKEQLDGAYIIQEEHLANTYNTVDEKTVPKYPETYEEDEIDINDVDDIIKKLNQEPPIRRSTRKRTQAMMTNVDEKRNYLQIPTPGNK